jgi:signal transduction histidine kinase
MNWSATALTGDPEDLAAVLLLGHDITELAEAQRQALQAERLAAIGQVTASLAHESRNAVQRTQACLERLSWRLKDPGELDLVARARAAQHELTRFFDEIRTYAAPLRLDVSACSLADAWREAWQQVLAVHPQRAAALYEACEGADLCCRADCFRMVQVFRNIFDNSLAACTDPMRVEVVAEEVVWNGGPALRLVVRDNGPGLGPGPHERLFEPFVTTRPHGSGLGLAIARRLIAAHGGAIAAGNGPGGGAEIAITLPRSPS